MKALQVLVPLARVNPWHWGRAEVLKFWEREALAYLGICVGCEWGVPGAGQGQALGAEQLQPTMQVWQPQRSPAWVLHSRGTGGSPR